MNHDLNLEISALELSDISKKLALRISSDYKSSTPILIGILKSSYVFLSDLTKEINSTIEVDFLAVNSYKGDKSTGTVSIVKDIKEDISGRDIIIVEDIIDTSLTIKSITKHLEAKNPASIKTCALLVKESIEDKPFYSGRIVPDDSGFFVGYGMDYNEMYRNLPEIYTIKL